MANRPPERFTVEIRPERQQVVLVLRGELDMASVGAVRSELDQLVDRGFERLVVDLRNLTFVDSTGLRLLLQQSQRPDAALALIDGAEPVSRLFDLTGTRPMFDFVDGS